MTFSKALELIKDGARMERAGWNGRGMYVALYTPEQGCAMTLPYIFMRTVTGDTVPWLASQTDILSSDWDVVEAAGADSSA